MNRPCTPLIEATTAPDGRPDDARRVQRQVDEVERRRPPVGGSSVASSPKIIELTVAVAAPSTDRQQGQRTDGPTSGIRSRTTPRAASAPR